MKSLEDARRGSQIPRIQIEPRRAGTEGDSAAELVAAYGFELDPWQSLVLDTWLGIDEKGDYTATTAGLSVPRQNGKNAVVEAREFYGLLINGEKILHTAHQVKTSKKAFHRIEALFTDESHPELQREVVRIRRTNGEESIELKNGGSIEYSARTRGASRGFAGISLVVYDEAQELQDEQVEAIMATLAASATGQRQLIYTGTPPGPNCPGTVFKRIRSAALDKPSEHTAWHEWSIDAKSTDDISTANRALWYECNPALGIRLDEDFTAEEQQTMSPDGFARERLGWWSPESASFAYLITKERWDAVAVNGPPESFDRLAYGVRFTPDGRSVSLAVAVTDGARVHVEYIRTEPTISGVGWLVDWIVERRRKCAAVAIDGRADAADLGQQLTSAGMPKRAVMVARTSDAIAADAMLVNAVNDGTLTHLNDPALTESALGAIRRQIGKDGGYGFGGECPERLDACALATWAVRTTRRKHGGRSRIG